METKSTELKSNLTTKELANQMYEKHRAAMEQIRSEILLHLEGEKCDCSDTKKKIRETLIEPFAEVIKNMELIKGKKFTNIVPIAHKLLEYICEPSRMKKIHEIIEELMLRDEFKLRITSMDLVVKYPEANQSLEINWTPVSIIFFCLWVASSDQFNKDSENRHLIIISMIEWCLISTEAAHIRINSCACDYFRLIIENIEDNQHLSGLIISKILAFQINSCENQCQKMGRECNGGFFQLTLEISDIISMINETQKNKPKNYFKETFLFNALILMHRLQISNNSLIKSIEKDRHKEIFKKIFEPYWKKVMKNSALDYANLDFNYDDPKGYDRNETQFTMVITCISLTLFNCLFSPPELQDNEQKWNTALDIENKSSYLQLSPDRLVVYNIQLQQSEVQKQSIRSKMCVKSGKFYYEVVILYGKSFKVGWATQKTRLTDKEVGDDEHSIAFDGAHVWHEGSKYEVENRINIIRFGDVIGCLIDFDNHQFTFSLNGETIRLKRQGILLGRPTIRFSKQFPYYAALSLGEDSMCNANFGQTAFKYQPKRVECWDFVLNENNIKKNQPTSGNITMGNVTIHNGQATIGSSLKMGNFAALYQANLDNCGLLSADHTGTVSCKLCGTQLPDTQCLRFFCCPETRVCLKCLKASGMIQCICGKEFNF